MELGFQAQRLSHKANRCCAVWLLSIPDVVLWFSMLSNDRLSCLLFVHLHLGQATPALSQRPKASTLGPQTGRNTILVY